MRFSHKMSLKGRCRRLGVDCQHASRGRVGLEQIRVFLAASDGVQFEGRNREEVHGWVDQTLRRQGYEELERAGRGFGATLPGEDDGAEPRAGNAQASLIAREPHRDDDS